VSAHADVTVVVTNYNYARFLGEAVSSALEQDGGAPHVIVVDDGSTEPETDAELAALPGAVEVVRQDNAGPSAARNAGLARAGTPFLIVLDADDKLLPGALNALKAALAEEPSLGFAYGITRFFGDWEGELGLPPYDPFRLLYRHMIGLTALMRRELFEATGGFDPGFRGFEDWELWLNALHHGYRGRRVPVETFLYRRHGPTGVNTAARRRYRQIYRALRAKHAALYARAPELAAETGATRLDQLVYRYFWGLRPIPARVEQALHALRWRS
jgi:glycosyltransferase involved in cell wall biosynthesis